MISYDSIKNHLKNTQYNWLVTGVAGFIGSNLLETLLKLNQRVVGLDNFSTGHQRNLNEVKTNVSENEWNNFTFFEGDIRKLEDCISATEGVDFVLHQAALGSVPRSLENPLATNDANITGFLNMLVASRDAKVKRFVYAASSSTYGDHEALPKVEHQIGKPLSPYAVTKLVNELYADVFSRCYNLDSIGLRYFNVFGPRQDPNGSYAAVIPKWLLSILNNQPITINGDGETTRDFCYIENTVQANLLAALTTNSEAVNQIYNVSVGDQTSLNQLYQLIQHNLLQHVPGLNKVEVNYSEFRKGDIRHSIADISKAKNLLFYNPSHRIQVGIALTVQWFLRNSSHG